MTLKIVKKAYKINLDKLDEGYLSDIILCHAENLNQAKKTLLERIKYDGWVLNYTKEEITYLNIPVIRAKEYDIVLFEDKPTSRFQIDEIIENRIRFKNLDKILNDESIEFCYIRKGPYYCPDWCGYTSHRHEAGVYTKKEAVDHARSVREIFLEPIDINKHNDMMNEKINHLKSRLIQI